jgi:hypothetical protein
LSGGGVGLGRWGDGLGGVSGLGGVNGLGGSNGRAGASGRCWDAWASVWAKLGPLAAGKAR